MTSLSRAVFLPDTLYRRRDDGYEQIRRADHPEHWAALAETRDPIITAVGVPEGAVSERSTSSSSALDAVESILSAASVQPGERVLEVGTGTGYVAYRLSELTQHVTSIDNNTEAIEHTQKIFARENIGVEVQCADGTHGFPASAPFDLIVATCSITDIPAAWIEQLTPHGRVIAPLHTRYHSLGLLEAQQQNSVMQGRLHEAWLEFMPLDTHAEFFGSTTVWDAPDTQWRQSSSEITAYDLYYRRDSVSHIACAHHDVFAHMVYSDDGCEATLWLIHPESHSVATHTTRAGEETHQIQQYGPRQLFDEISATYEQWVQNGRPSYTQLRITQKIPQGECEQR